MQITVVQKQKISQTAADKISHLLRELKTPLLLLLSGGSAFEIYDKIDTSVLSNKVTVGMLDERYDFDDTVNNFAQLEKTEFYKKADKQNVEFINTYPTMLETQEELADRFEESLRDWKKENPKGTVIAVVGIGPDGHTSGIMPMPEDKEKFEDLFEQDKWVVGYNTEDKIPFPERVTTTITFMKNEIDNAIVYVSDEKKKDILKKVIEKDKPVYEIPGRVINEMKKVELVTVVSL